MPIKIGSPTNRPPVAINSVRLFSHSFADSLVTGTSSGTLTTDGSSFINLFTAAQGIGKHKLINASANGAQFLQPLRAQGFARCLSEVQAYNYKTQPPFMRTTGALTVFCLGINDIGNNTPANQALLRSSYQDCLIACVSKARASQVFLATNAAWSFGANFSTSPTSSAEFTSGVSTSKQATVVDSAGTSTATFKIPFGYQGEPICFNMVGLSGGSLIVTWGGTVTGTTSIVGRTDTLSGIALQAQSAHPVRFTAAANGLSAANAGQTITVRITTVSASTFTLDGCWIEAFKPNPVVICNVGRLPEVSYNLALGDGVTTGVNTSFTSATANFSSTTDASQAITETDAQGAFTAGKTVSSVTNATTIVLSGNATGAFSNIKFTLARRVRGYSAGFYTINTDFTAATIASHSAADAHITNFNAMLATVASTFGAMVQVADFDTALGIGDTVLPANVYTMTVDGLHPNELGHQRMAMALQRAVEALRPENDGQVLNDMEMALTASFDPGPDRRPIFSGGIYVPEFCAAGATYTAVAGDVFAFPVFFTEPNIVLGASMVEQINAPATSGSNIRIGLYDDHNCLGYPQNLRHEPTSGGTFAMGTTSGVKNPGAFGGGRNPHYGLYWFVIKIDSLGTTASQFRTIVGPNKYLPNWLVAGGAATPIAWKLTGVGAGALPTIFPSGAALSSSAPMLGVTFSND